MNVNGSRFELLLGRADWGRCLYKNGGEVRTLGSWWDRGRSSSLEAPADLPAWDERRLEIGIHALPITLPATPTELPLDRNARRGAAADRYGNVYRITDDRRALAVRTPGAPRDRAFWPASPDACEDERARADLDFEPVDAVERGQPEEYLALAVTADHYLVVAFARGSTRGFITFDLVAGGAPVPTLWPASAADGPPDERLTAFDMAPRHAGGVWLLDREHRRLWELDCKLGVVAAAQASEALAGPELDDFQPLAGDPRERPGVVFPQGIDLSASPASMVDPIAVESLAEGVVLILDADDMNERARVVRMRRDRDQWHVDGSDWLDGLSDRAHDFVIATAPHYQDESPVAEIFVATRSGNQASAYRIVEPAAAFGLEKAVELFPLRRFRGRALVAICGRAHYDSGGDAFVWAPIVQQPRALFGRAAVFITPIFDSGDIGTIWDRVLVDACLPADTAIEILSRAGDERADLGASPEAAPEVIGTWQAEPAPYLRGAPEIPWVRREAVRATRRERGIGTWELLLQNAHGRYLQLHIRLTSANGMATPRIRALRAWSPRFSYPQRFLPAVYREDAAGGPFLDRWLANMESTLTGIEDRVVNLQSLFDPRVTPAETLGWLAGWFDVAFDPAWDERRRRLFIRHAMDFFRWRGTVHGLRLGLELAFNPCIDERAFEEPPPGGDGPRQIRIVETYQTRLTGSLVAGDPGGSEPGPREISTTSRWTPQEGNAGLAARYAALLGREATFQEQVQPFTLVRPGGAAGVTWVALMQSALGFVPSIGAADRARWNAFLVAREREAGDAALPNDMPASDADRQAWTGFNAIADGAWLRGRWHDFLARRYRRIERLNRAWETHWTTFDLVAMHDVLPRTAPAQVDWMQFEREVLPMHRTAHRFSVLLPISGVSGDPMDRERQLGLAQRIVELEKPAHTVFDVRFFWAFFRVGEARLGLDTQIGDGSRAPELIPDAVLGRAYLGASFVGGGARPRDGDRLLAAH